MGTVSPLRDRLEVEANRRTALRDTVWSCGSNERTLDPVIMLAQAR